VLILEHKTCAPHIEELEEALQRTQEELQKEGRSLRQALDEANRREDALRASLKTERAVIADVSCHLVTLVVIVDGIRVFFLWMRIITCCGSGANVLEASLLKRSPCRMFGCFGLLFLYVRSF
jgi:hypothetical protein